MNDTYMLALVAVTGGVTILLRALPFIMFSSGKQPPAVIGYIGRVLSPAAIAMLVIYCMAGYAQTRMCAEHMFGAAEIIAAIVVVALQLWRKNPLLSIIAGTAIYMFLVQSVI